MRMRFIKVIQQWLFHSTTKATQMAFVWRIVLYTSEPLITNDIFHCPCIGLTDGRRSNIHNCLYVDRFCRWSVIYRFVDDLNCGRYLVYKIRMETMETLKKKICVEFELKIVEIVASTTSNVNYRSKQTSNFVNFLFLFSTDRLSFISLSLSIVTNKIKFF